MANQSHDTSGHDQHIRQYIPSTTLCIEAFDLAKSTLPETILNHSLRTFLYAKWLAEKEGIKWADAEHVGFLFVACICHDFGACVDNGGHRFEIEGADAATSFLQKAGVVHNISHEVWTAIALHTSPGIAERIAPLARLVRLAVLIDFVAKKRDAYGAQVYAAELEARIPRLDIEKTLADLVVAQALKGDVDIKAPPATWPGVLLRSHLDDPEWQGVNKAF